MPSGPDLQALIPNVGTDVFGAVVTQITALAHGYTRGQGFDVDGHPTTPDLSAVILLAARRALAFYSQLTLGRGAVFTYVPFAGWNLAEQVVLNRYRVRAG